MRDLELKVIEPPYFSNWGDLFFPKLANKLVPFAAAIPFLTPNMVTVGSFSLYVLGSLFLFINIPYHLFISAILLPLSYTLDCMDGQLARVTKRSSHIGDYLDKVLDVLKIYVITLSLAYAVYLQIGGILPFILGFTACFFFNFRYYIKLESIFNRVSNVPNYLIRSRELRLDLYEEKGSYYKRLNKTLMGKLQVFWYWNRTIFFVDEAEFVIFVALGALFNQLELTLWILVISQLCIGIFRFFERGYQINTSSDRLLRPMRK